MRFILLAALGRAVVTSAVSEPDLAAVLGLTSAARKKTAIRGIAVFVACVADQLQVIVPVTILRGVPHRPRVIVVFVPAGTRRWIRDGERPPEVVTICGVATTPARLGLVAADVVRRVPPVMTNDERLAACSRAVTVAGRDGQGRRRTAARRFPAC